VRSRAEASVAAALLLAAAGCATSPPASPGAAQRREEVGYFAARARDLARVFDLSLHLGPGLGARLSATRRAQIGWLAVGPSEGGARLIEAMDVAVGLHDGEVGAWTVRSIEYGVSPWFYGDEFVRRVASDESSRRIDPSEQRATRLSAQVHLALVGAEVGFDPVALVRFFTGLVGLGADRDRR